MDIREARLVKSPCTRMKQHYSQRALNVKSHDDRSNSGETYIDTNDGGFDRTLGWNGEASFAPRRELGANHAGQFREFAV